MSIVRPNPALSRNIEEELIQLKQDLRLAEEILTLRVNPGWMRLNAEVVERVKTLETILDTFEKLTERDLVLTLKEMKDFRWMRDFVGAVEKKVPELHEAILNTEQRIAERKKQNGADQS